MYRHAARTNGQSLAYNSWRSMRSRCLNAKDHKYPRYGGAGIRICAQWNDFARFLADMGPRPSRAYSIDRIDNWGHYEPGNCRWADGKTQNNNRDDNHRVTFQGENLTLTKWERRLGLDRRMLLKRLAKGLSVERAFTLKPQPRRALIPNLICRNGHAFTPENVYMQPNGQRRCRSCKRITQKRRKQ